MNSLRRPFISHGETTSSLGNRESIGKVPERRTILILSFLISHTTLIFGGSRESPKQRLHFLATPAPMTDHVTVICMGVLCVTSGKGP